MLLSVFTFNDILEGKEEWQCGSTNQKPPS